MTVSLLPMYRLPFCKVPEVTCDMMFNDGEEGQWFNMMSFLIFKVSSRQTNRKFIGRIVTTDV